MSRDALFNGFVLFALSFMLFLTTASISLDDWDSVQFAKGVTDYDIGRHQPHPSGYPLYIWAGQIVSFIFDASAQLSLQVVSSLCGALFVASWYLIAVLAGAGTATGALGFAAALAVVPATWMVATKVLTDIPASGFWALCLLLIALARALDRRWLLVAAGLAAAVSVGMRPQNVHVLLLVVCLGLWWVRAPLRWWLASIGAYAAGCVAWLVAMMWTQALRYPELGWMAYIEFTHGQWRWRLDRPDVSILAGDWSPLYLLARLDEHVSVSILKHGMGLMFDVAGLTIVLATILVLVCVAGLVLYVRRCRARGAEEASFWRLHAPWAVLYCVTIFVTLPGDTRYYTPIVPLLIWPVAMGWTVAPARFAPWTYAALPLVLFLITYPFIMEARTQLGPPQRLVQFLEERYPDEASRKRVAINVGESYRHFYRSDGWGALALGIQVTADETLFQDYDVLYTDSYDLVDEFSQPGKQVAISRISFDRSPFIHRKHAHMVLFRIVPEKPRVP